MAFGDPEFLQLFFKEANHWVEQSVIEDLLYHMTSLDEYDYFVSFLNTEIIEPKVLSNNETLFTSLLKENRFKYSLAIIHYAINRKCVNLKNALNQTPLQIAIEGDA